MNRHVFDQDNLTFEEKKYLNDYKYKHVVDSLFQILKEKFIHPYDLHKACDLAIEAHDRYQQVLILEPEEPKL